VTPRVLAVLWLALGVAIWNGFNDIYVSRGAHEYLQKLREFELGRGPNPDMTGVMVQAQRAGVQAASIWAGTVVAAGWGTIWVLTRTKVRRARSEVRS
jgi:hypothetical protein